MRASVVSLGDDLERLDVQRLIGNDVLQPPVLVFELLKPHEVARFEAAVFRAPRVQRCLANAILAAEVGRFQAGFEFLARAGIRWTQFGRVKTDPPWRRFVSSP